MADPNLPNKALVSLHVFVPSFYSISELKTWTIYDRIPTNLSFQISAIFFLFGLHLYLANVISFFLINLNFLTTKIPRDSLLFRGKQVFFFSCGQNLPRKQMPFQNTSPFFWLVNSSRFALAPCLILLQKYQQYSWFLRKTITTIILNPLNLLLFVIFSPAQGNSCLHLFLFLLLADPNLANCCIT